MWPKAFAQLIELAPHISRLLPMADRFFQSKTVTDDPGRINVEGLAEGLRGDLGKVQTGHAVLGRQISELGDQVATSGADARAARAAVESLEVRLSRMEARQQALSGMMPVVLVLVIVALILLIVLLVRHH